MAETRKRGPGRPPGSKNKKSSSQSERQSATPKSKQEHIEELRLQNEKDKRTNDVIWSITLIALGVFLLFTVVRDSTGTFGMKIHDVCMGLFGIMAYALPFMFMLAGILLLLRKLQHIGGRTAICGILIFIQMCILNSYRFISAKSPSFGFADIVIFFKNGVEGKEGGAVGMEFGSILVKAFGQPGLLIAAITILIICIFLVANTPISKFFENLHDKRETRKLLAEIDAAEKAKVQQAVASTAHIADPVPVYRASEPASASDDDTSIIMPPIETRAVNPADLKDTFVTEKEVMRKSDASDVSPFTEVKPDRSNEKQGGFWGIFKKNTIEHPQTEKDAGKYDSEDVGISASADKPVETKKSYGLGNDEDFGKSGSFGLGDYYSGEKTAKKPTKGLAEETECAGSVEQAPIKKRTRSPKPVEDITPVASAVAASAVAGTSEKTVKEKTESDNSDDVDAMMDAALNSVQDDDRYVFPPVSLLKKSTAGKQMMSDFQLQKKAELLEQTLKNFGVIASVVSVVQGASVTRYEVQPAVGVKVSSITKLADDIALNLRAKSIRIEAPIPGKAAVGIEVENDKPAPVLVRDLIESEEFEKAESRISFIVGKDISGSNIVADLKSMPHLLIAGATGSGKSVCINTIIASFLYKAKPSELKLIMIDPKVVELQAYNGIPHMLVPVVTEPRKAAKALAFAVEEMNKRYDAFAKVGVKDLESYNDHMRGEQEYANVKPQIVIIIDELADLMMACSNEVETSICRLAQKARAAGMHLIVATQRPSVDVVTGLIKSNIPSRIAFSVSSQIDSRTILDMAGAEKLLGKGDMLFSPVGSNKPYRVQGPFISEGESQKIIDFVKKQGGDAVYDEEVQTAINSDGNSGSGSSEPSDELTEDAIAFILKSKQASVSMLQRRFRIGYNRAARIIDEIEAKGIIGPSDGSRPRQVLVTEEEYYSYGDENDEAVETYEEPAEQEKDSFGSSDGEQAFSRLPESVQKEILSSDD